MIEEIIYTSAPKGLRSGSHGFCTVISTAGMAANMAERLESMSGYRHAFPLNDANNSLNPVNHVHVTTRMAGEKRHVISRIADAGQDYSGRTNKLAHHIALENIQAITAGPARLLDSGLLVTVWDGKVETRSPRVVSNPEVPVRIQLSAWNAVTGDGGWAGYVAENLLASKAPVNVIFAAGTETMPLVVEVLDLIPVPKRWSITFSTYFTRLLAGTECQLRFFLNGTSQATTIRNDARATIVDLTMPLSPAEGGPLVAKSRAGVLEHTAPAVRKATERSPGRGKGQAVSNAELDQFLETDDEFSVHTDDVGAEDQFAAAAARNSRLSGTFRQKKTRMPIPVIAAIAVVLVSAIGMLAFVLSRPSETDVALGVEQSPPVFERVPAVESFEHNTDTFNTPNVDEQPQVHMGPDPVPVSPFGSKHPFDSIRSLLVSESGATVWQLPATTQDSQVDEWKINVSSAEPVSVRSPTDAVSVTESFDDANRKWILAVDGIQLGWFQVDSGHAEEAARLSWMWDSGIGESTDIFSPAANALRTLRGCRVTFESAERTEPYFQPADSLTIQLGGDNWPRFAHLGSGDDNLGVTLQVPAPGSMSDSGDLNRESNSIYLEAELPDAVSLQLLPEFNALIDGHDAFITESIAAAQGSRLWNLGLMPKGSDPDHGEIFGQYKLVRHAAEPGIVSLSFEWLPNRDSEFAAPLQWLPIDVSIAGQSQIVFARGPGVFAARELVDLGQADQCDIPMIPNNELPLRFSNDTVEVNFEIAVRSETGALSGELKATRQNPSPQTELSFFELKAPLKLTATEPGQSAGLGTAVIVATPVETLSGVVPTAVELHTEASFNRSTLYFLNTLQPANVFAPVFWQNNGKFRMQPFVKSANAFLKQVTRFSGSLASDLRCTETRLAKYSKQKDTFRRIAKDLHDMIVEFDRILTFSDTELRSRYPRVIPSALGQRNNPRVKSLLQKQKDELEKLGSIYDEKHWDADAKTIASVREDLSKLTAEVRISLQLKRENGTPIRIYIVSTSANRGVR